ncbi:MAG: hypothetical protein ACKOXB_07985 [Flavobacteriales bacterium]
MKSKFLLPFALVAVAMFMFSCQSSVSIAKKRYSNGYYVSVSNETKEKSENTFTAKNELKVANKQVNNNKENIQGFSVASSAPVIAAVKAEETKSATNTTVKQTLSKKAAKLKENIKKKALQKIDLSDGEGDMSDRFLIILIITIIIPPLGVFLYKQQLRPTLIDLLLILIGVILSYFLPIYGFGLGFLAGLIYGLLYIFGKI